MGGEIEDGFGAVEAPPGAGDFRPVVHERQGGGSRGSPARGYGPAERAGADECGRYVEDEMTAVASGSQVRLVVPKRSVSRAGAMRARQAGRR